MSEPVQNQSCCLQTEHRSQQWAVQHSNCPVWPAKTMYVHVSLGTGLYFALLGNR